VNEAGSNWQFLTLIVTSVTAFVLLVTVIVAWSHVRATRKSTDAQLAVGLYKTFYGAETRKIVRSIYELDHEKIMKLLRSEKDEIEMVLNFLDMIGHLLKQGGTDKYLAVGALGGAPALRCWHKLGQCIKEEREERRGGYYCIGLEYFAKFVIKYQITNTPINQWIKFYPGPLGEKETVNLIVEELKQPHLLSTWEFYKAKALSGICQVIAWVTGCPKQYDMVRIRDNQWVCFCPLYLNKSDRQRFDGLTTHDLKEIQETTLVSGWELSKVLFYRTLKSIAKTELQ
jgi:hypothetical protein